MIIAAIPKKLINKPLTKRELDQYFNANSVEELVIVLRQYERDGFFDFKVTLSQDYPKWEKAHRKVILRGDVLEPFDPFGVMSRGKYRLDYLYPKIEKTEPLSDKEIIDVINKLPQGMVERFVKFKLANVDYKKLHEAVAPKPEITPESDKDESYGAVQYNGLVADGAEVTYLSQRIEMRFQLRQILRAFLNNPNKLLAPDVFIGDIDIFKPDKKYKNANVTLGKFIFELHRELKPFAGECIFNEPSEGWYLKIE